MSFSSIGKFIPGLLHPKIGQQAAIALALEAGEKYLQARDSRLTSRVRLVSAREGVVHALATSAAAAEGLKSMENGLFAAMETASGIKFLGLKISLRGALVKESLF